MTDLEQRQVARQIRLFMQDGDRNRLNVALAILEPNGEPDRDETPPWHYNHPDNIAARRPSPHTLAPDGRGQGMRVCTKCGRTEAEPDEPCEVKLKR